MLANRVSSVIQHFVGFVGFVCVHHYKKLIIFHFISHQGYIYNRLLEVFIISLNIAAGLPTHLASIAARWIRSVVLILD